MRLLANLQSLLITQSASLGPISVTSLYTATFVRVALGTVLDAHPRRPVEMMKQVLLAPLSLAMMYDFMRNEIENAIYLTLRLYLTYPDDMAYCCWRFNNQRMHDEEVNLDFNQVLAWRTDEDYHQQTMIQIPRELARQAPGIHAIVRFIVKCIWKVDSDYCRLSPEVLAIIKIRAAQINREFVRMQRQYNDSVYHTNQVQPGIRGSPLARALREARLPQPWICFTEHEIGLLYQEIMVPPEEIDDKSTATPDELVVREDIDGAIYGLGHSMTQLENADAGNTDTVNQAQVDDDVGNTANDAERTQTITETTEPIDATNWRIASFMSMGFTLEEATERASAAAAGAGELLPPVETGTHTPSEPESQNAIQAEEWLPNNDHLNPTTADAQDRPPSREGLSARSRTPSPDIVRAASLALHDRSVTARQRPRDHMTHPFANHAAGCLCTFHRQHPHAKRKPDQRVTVLSLLPIEIFAAITSKILTTIILLPLESLLLRSLTFSFLRQSATIDPGSAALTWLASDVRPLGQWFGSRGGTGSGTSRYVGNLAVCLGLQSAVSVGVWLGASRLAVWLGRNEYHWGSF